MRGRGMTTSVKKVQLLVERAYKTDPRVAAYKREQERLREEKEVVEHVYGVRGSEKKKRNGEKRRDRERRSVSKRSALRGRRRRVVLCGVSEG